MTEQAGGDAPQRYSILMVDDVRKNVEPVRLILSGQPYDIEYAADGPEALERAAGMSFDLILLDIMMPGMDGFEVCTRLKEQDATRDIPVIFLTARSERDSVVRGFEYGAVDYIARPYHALELLARVRTHLDLHDKTRRLRAMNASLEDMVTERTARLAEAHAKLARLDAVKSNFLMLVSHELRTPLHELLGFTALMDASAPTAEQREYLASIRASSERLKRLVDVALFITSLQTDTYALRFQPMPAFTLLERCRAYLADTAAERGIMLAISPPSDTLRVVADAGLADHALRAVTENAIRHSPEGGIVELSAESVPGTVRIIVRDHGPGFSNEAMQQVFTLFAATDMLHHHRGLGLGLATAKLICDAHEATLAVRNHSDGGAEAVLAFAIP